MSVNGEPFASCREADVFALDGDRVLRRYRDGSDATAEAAVMAYVARHGFPVPTVHKADGPDLVMDRVDGPTMADALVAGKLDLVKGGVMLAELHRRLHAVPPQSGVSFARIVHLDLHPENVMLTARGPVVIDWRNATEGDPGLDVALSALILGEVVVNPTMSFAGLARELLGHFVAQVDDDPVRCLPQAVVRRELNVTLNSDEHQRLGAAAAVVRTLAEETRPEE